MKTAVIGAGSWGTALASLLAGKLPTVTLWCREEEVAREMNSTHRNPLHIREMLQPENIRAVTDLEETVATHDLFIMVVPVQYTRSLLRSIRPVLREGARFVSASKGIEVENLALLSTVYRDLFGSSITQSVSFLSGPSFAREVMAQHPTAVAIAGENRAFVQEVQTLFHTPHFRTYITDDVVGLEVGGALKNVIALAAGISDGLGFGNSTRAAIITRGLAEMVRLGVRLGGRAATFSGLSGLGDLLLTATSDLSRNRTMGRRLGSGESLQAVQRDSHEVAEGVKTTLSVRRLAETLDIEMPITYAVHDILYAEKDPRAVVSELMTRALKSE